MTHIGVLCPAMTGHINSVVPLAQELKRRGHAVTFFQFPDAQTSVEAAGLNFCAIAQAQCPAGTLADRYARLAQLTGLQAARYTIDLFRWFTELQLQHLPPALQAANTEALIVDQTMVEGMSVAQLLDLPSISFASALPFNREATIPPYITGWAYGSAWWRRLRNHLTYEAINVLARKNRQLLNAYRQQWGLAPLRHYAEAYSPLAQISQLPVEFEFPRKQLPPWFHFTGPYHYSNPGQPPPFPFEQLNDQPMIYASLGTLMNQHRWIFSVMAQACADLPVQLVITLGDRDLQDLPSFPGNPIVAGYAPQLELLKQASLVITHAGLNTTLEALTQGVPLVAIPITNDEPAIAARIVWAGVGEKIEPSKLTPERLRTAIQKVLNQPRYRQQATRIQKAIQRSGGVSRAADIVEQAIKTRQPVLTQSFAESRSERSSR